MEKNKTFENVSPPAEVYLKKDSYEGFIEDENEIEYYSAFQQLDVLEFGLLGDYSKNGVYVISDEIVRELISCKKKITGNYGDLIFVSSVAAIDAANLQFSVKIEDAENLHLLATLELMEVVEKAGGEYLNTIITPIAVFEDVKDETFKDKMLKAFNILTETSARDELTEKAEKLEEIANRKLFLKKLFEETEVEIKEKNKELFFARIKALNTTKSGEIFIGKLKENLNNKTIVINKNFKAVNQVLDAMLESLPKDKADEMKDVIKESAKVAGPLAGDIKKSISSKREKFVEKLALKTNNGKETLAVALSAEEKAAKNKVQTFKKIADNQRKVTNGKREENYSFALDRDENGKTILKRQLPNKNDNLGKAVPVKNKQQNAPGVLKNCDKNKDKQFKRRPREEKEGLDVFETINSESLTKRAGPKETESAKKTPAKTTGNSGSNKAPKPKPEKKPAAKKPAAKKPEKKPEKKHDPYRLVDSYFKPDKKVDEKAKEETPKNIDKNAKEVKKEPGNASANEIEKKLEDIIQIQIKGTPRLDSLFEHTANNKISLKKQDEFTMDEK